jgi:hypothetical protein
MDRTTNREEALFIAALGQDSAEARAAFLLRECADDPELRAQVEELLNHHESRTDELFLLDRAPLGSTAVTTGAAGDGVIGRYKLLESIGEGGMGVVYLAEQVEPVRRHVAVKVIKPGLDTKQVVARFEAERQALALFDHPGIAKVLDAGATQLGRPYFVMELVRGTRITDYCSSIHLAVRERIKLLIQVCHAVQHAHQKGVIHRDLKPSNVLVTLQDTGPLPKVIDFGIAKAINQPLTEQTAFTRCGEMIGTPEYMSPEQAEMNGMNIDTRTDVYSLGVLLYELLTGSPPFDPEELRQSSHQDMVTILRTREVDPPSYRIARPGSNVDQVCAAGRAERDALRRLLRGDLDWVVLRALSKDRTQRYPSASEMARDLQRYLNGEPVEAAPPSASYRLGKFAAKHRAVLIAVLVFVAGLLVSSVACAALAWKAMEAEGVASDRLANLQIERDRAVKAERAVKKLARQRLLALTWSMAVTRLIDEQGPKLLAPGSGMPMFGGPRLTFGKAPGSARNESPLMSFSFRGSVSPKDVLQFEDACLLNIDLDDGGLLTARTTPPSHSGNASVSNEMIPASDPDFLGRIRAHRTDLLGYWLEAQRKALDPSDGTLADCLDLLAAAWIEASHPEKAEPYLRESLQLRQQPQPAAAPPPVDWDGPGYCRTATLLAKCLVQLKRNDEARGVLWVVGEKMRHLPNADSEVGKVIDRLLQRLDQR